MADGYDELWSRHVVQPNERLTRELALARGERLADLACGTGLYTVDMARRVAPGEVVAVDYSEGMLAAARERAEGEGLSLRLVHAKAEDFVAGAQGESFDVISCRFALAYVDWRDVLPRMGRLLRRGGRVGLLTSISNSIPQFFDLFDRYRGSFGTAWSLYKHVGGSFAKAFRLYHQMRGIFGTAPRAPTSTACARISWSVERASRFVPDASSFTIMYWVLKDLPTPLAAAMTPFLFLFERKGSK